MPNSYKDTAKSFLNEMSRNIKNDDFNGEKENNSYNDNISDIFIKVMEDFKKNFILKNSTDEVGAEEFIKRFYESKLFNEKLNNLATLVKNLKINPPFVSNILTKTIFGEIDKKINFLRKNGVIEDDEKINFNNFLNEFYIKSVIESAKEHNIDLSEDDIYRWLILRPVFYNYEKFLESVKKITGLSNDEIEQEILKEDGIVKDFSKEKEIEKLFSVFEMFPYNMSHIFSTQRMENINSNVLNRVSNKVYLFDGDEVYKNIPSLKNNITFETFAKKDLLSAIKTLVPDVDNDALIKIEKYLEDFSKNGISIVPNEDNPFVIPALYLKQDILKNIEKVANSKEITSVINQIIKMQDEIKNNSNRFVLANTVNGWITFIPQKQKEIIEKNNYELIYKDNKLYYFNEDGEKILIDTKSESIEEKVERDKEIMKEIAKTESEFLNKENNFITGTIYKRNENGDIEIPKSKIYLTEVLSKRNGEIINVDGVNYLRTNFDAEFFDSIYGKFSKRDAWYQLISIIRNMYGLDSSDLAREKIKKDGLGELIIERSIKELEKYKSEALKALSLVKTGTFLNEDGSLKKEFISAKNEFFDKLFTKKEIEYFQEESDRLLNNLKKVKVKNKTYRTIINESAESLYSEITDFIVKKFLKEDEKYSNKKELLELLERKKREFSENPEFRDAYAIFKQLVIRDFEVERKIKVNKEAISFIKTNLELSTDLRLTDDFNEKVNKLFNKSIKNHFIKNVFKETNLLKNALGLSNYSDNEVFFITMPSFKDNPISNVNVDNLHYIHPDKYYFLKTNLMDHEDAENLFDLILKKVDNVDKIEEIINSLENGNITDSEIRDFVDNNEKIFALGINLEKDVNSIRDFLKRIKVNTKGMSDDEVSELFTRLKEEKSESFLKEWNNFVYNTKLKTIANSIRVIYNNLSKDVLQKAFSLKEEYNLSNDEFSDILKKYSFLSELESEYKIRKKLYELAFEKSIKGGVYPPKSVDDIVKNLKLHLNKIEEDYDIDDIKRDKEKALLINGTKNLIALVESNKKIDLKDIKKTLIPRNEIDKVFGLFKAHIIENDDAIKEYETSLSKTIQKSFEKIENLEYNKYIGMFEQLKNRDFTYNIKSIVDKSFLSKIDESFIDNYKSRLTQEHNIIANLNLLYGDIVYKAAKKTYNSIKIKKRIENTLNSSKKGLLPLLVKDNDKESFVLTIQEKDVEELYNQYIKIFKKIKDDFIDENGNFYIPDDKFSDLTEKEKIFIKQLFALSKISFPYHDVPNKKERLNAIMGLMFTLNGTPLIEKKDIDFSKKRLHISKQLKETFPFLKDLDDKLTTIDVNTSDMEINEYKSLKNKISLNDEIENFDDEKKNFDRLINELETNLLTISTEIDTLDSKIKTIKSEMVNIHEKFERRFNENLRQNRALNGSSLENAFNFVRFPILMFEAFQIGLETAKQVVGEYFEYRRKVTPLREEVNKRKEDLLVLMDDAKKIEDEIAIDIQEFYVGFYSQNYSTVEEMINIIEKIGKNGNMFAKHILERPDIVERDNNGKIISIDLEKLYNEVKRVNNLLNGVSRINQGGYRNIESLSRARQRLKSIFAESQPTIFNIIFGSKDMVFYDDFVNFKARKMFSTKFELKEDVKAKLIGDIDNIKIEELNNYLDIERVLTFIEKFNSNELIRSKNGSLMIFNIDEKALSELKKQLTKGDEKVPLKNVIDTLIKKSSLYTIDYKDESDFNSILKSLKNNSELSKSIEEKFLSDKRLNKLISDKSLSYKVKNEIKTIIFKYFINNNSLSDEEIEKLNKAGISFKEINNFFKKEDIKHLTLQSLHKVYFNTTKRFYSKTINDDTKNPSPLFEKVIQELELVKRKEISEKEFEEKYKIKVDDIKNIKNIMREKIKTNIIDSIDLNKFDNYHNKKIFGGGRISSITKLLINTESIIASKSSTFLEKIGKRIKEIELDKDRHLAKIRSMNKFNKSLNKTNKSLSI